MTSEHRIAILIIIVAIIVIMTIIVIVVRAERSREEQMCERSVPALVEVHVVARA